MILTVNKKISFKGISLQSKTKMFWKTNLACFVKKKHLQSFLSSSLKFSDNKTKNVNKL